MKPKLLSIDNIVKLGSVEAAPLLLGWILCRQVKEGVIKVRIVETEAYHQADPASHSFRGLTPRTAPMFQAGGRLYIYFTYGMHYAINVVTGQAGEGEAVLIRAAEPVQGIEIMQTYRGITDAKNLTNGPGKLAQAIGIKDTKLTGKILNKSSIWLEPPEKPIDKPEIITSTRIGITRAADQPWRFYLKGNPYVSKL